MPVSPDQLVVSGECHGRHDPVVIAYDQHLVVLDRPREPLGIELTRNAVLIPAPGGSAALHPPPTACT
jgi:hypothetical protein